MARSYRERMDPDGEFDALTTGMQAITSGPLGWLLKRAGVDEGSLETARSARQTYEELVAWGPEVAESLAPLGWIAFGNAPANEYREAARLAGRGDVDAAEELLTKAWNDGDRLRWGVRRVLSIYRGDEEVRMIGVHRRRLLDEALEDHSAGRYASAVNLVLPQIDGIVHDLTGQEARTFFAGAKSHHLQDEETLAGHPDGLPVLSQLFTRGQRRTTIDGGLGRHGILHGRALGYDTLRNSTKVMVALLAVLEWAKPHADVRAEQLERDQAERYAGNEEVGEYGERLDQREFRETKAALQNLAGMQMGWYRNRGGRYRSELIELLSANGLPAEHGFKMFIAEGGQAWWAWRRTVSGWCFAIGANEPPPNQWLFDGPEPPTGFPGNDPVWGSPFGVDAVNW